MIEPLDEVQHPQPLPTRVGSECRRSQPTVMRNRDRMLEGAYKERSGRSLGAEAAHVAFSKVGSVRRTGS